MPGGGSSSAFAGSAGSVLRTVGRYSPEPISPEGVEGQICVLADGRATWARSYRRNTRGDELQAVRTVMGHGVRTAETRCTGESQDERSDCEMPHRSSCGGSAECVAVAGRAGGGGSPDRAAEEAPLLLRSGSDPARPAAG
ncbi:hypothetical protein ACIQ6K_05120 [Streptomyces sp. NPDC096354]|uniref:hypothetical protein n=1 Tax=Streptomyces sp. NPDC096354 TaxID=3366088 RepID=UPI0038091E9D